MKFEEYKQYEELSYCCTGMKSLFHSMYQISALKINRRLFSCASIPQISMWFALQTTIQYAQ